MAQRRNSHQPRDTRSMGMTKRTEHPPFRPVPDRARSSFPDWQAEQMRRDLLAMRAHPGYQAALDVREAIDREAAIAEFWETRGG